MAGLFGQSFSPARDYDEIFVSVEEAEKVVEKVEEVVKEAEGVTARREEDWRVRVEGQDGNFVVVVGVNRLTEELVVIQVKMREWVGATGLEFWKGMLRPAIVGLVNKPGGLAVDGGG